MSEKVRGIKDSLLVQIGLARQPAASEAVMGPPATVAVTVYYETRCLLTD